MTTWDLQRLEYRYQETAATWILANWRHGNEKTPEEETRATKSAGRDTARKKSRVKYGWVHNFGVYQVNYAKHSEMTFFYLSYRFGSWQITTNGKQKMPNCWRCSCCMLHVHFSTNLKLRNLVKHFTLSNNGIGIS